MGDSDIYHQKEYHNYGCLAEYRPTDKDAYLNFFSYFWTTTYIVGT